MNPDDQRAETIFAAARELPTPAAQAAFLAKVCGQDESLRKRMEGLLQAEEAAKQFFKGSGRFGQADTQPISEETVMAPAPLTEGPGTRIGRYKLLQQIGEGGMGVVYMAEQEEPVSRRVALKVIKLGMDTRQVVARFEAERQALALMDHPNIARVLDGGATDTGRPYFVMELVQGVPITEFCDKAKLPARDRLKLFMQVCQAIQSAHQKGIIHRDIKPSNVLVTLHDGVPVPKVIDFGIAKATNQKLTEKTLFTNFATMIGTPAYMSPEQAEMSGLDIDTRTDIYALGVLLYALLTGTTPFPEKRLLSLGYGEMQRVILEEEPERPSTRLSTMANEQKTIVAKNCGEELASLSNLLKGDLDWIVMKCLEKDRQRRYETANGLASDIQRHLSNEPVIARPPSAAYRFQKLARRNRSAFAAVTAVAAALVLGVVISAWQAIRATEAERQQSALRQKAVKAQTGEARQRALAEQRVYDSLVRETRALRLARRVGYRDKVFSLLRQAAAIEGANKDFGELRREAVACLGDFVGRTPVTFTNWMSGFVVIDACLSLSGQWAAFILWDKPNHKQALVLREVPKGNILISDITERNIDQIGFIGSDRLAVLHTPHRNKDGEKERGRYAEAEVAIWGADQRGEWRQLSRERMPGACRFVTSATRSFIAQDDVVTDVLNLIDPQTKTLFLQVPVPKGMPSPPYFDISDDGHFLAIEMSNSTTETGREISLWDLQLKKEALRKPLGAAEEVMGFNSDGSHLITSLDDKGYMVVHDSATYDQVAKISDSVIGGHSPVMPNHKIIALPTYLTREVRLVDYMRQEVVATLDEPRNPFMVAFSADGETMMTVGVLYARFYNLADDKAERHLKGRPDAFAAAIHPSATRVALSSRTGGITMWNMERNQVVWQNPSINSGEMSYSADGTLLLVAAQGDQGQFIQRFFIVDATTGEKLLTVGDGSFGFASPVVSSDGLHLVCSYTKAQGGWDSTALTSDDPTLGSVVVYKLEHRNGTSKKLEAKELHRMVGKYCSFVFLGASNKVAFMDNDMYPALYVWDILSTNAPTKLPARPRWSYGNLAPTPDGHRLWMIGFDGKLICVDSTTGERVSGSDEGFDRWDFFGAPGVSLSPDGSKLAVTSTADRSTEIFDATTGRLLYNLPAINSADYTLAWAEDSRNIIVSRFNGDLSIWNLADVDQVLADLGLSDGHQEAKPARRNKNLASPAVAADRGSVLE